MVILRAKLEVDHDYADLAASAKVPLTKGSSTCKLENPNLKVEVQVLDKNIQDLKISHA